MILLLYSFGNCINGVEYNAGGKIVVKHNNPPKYKIICINDRGRWVLQVLFIHGINKLRYDICAAICWYQHCVQNTSPHGEKIYDGIFISCCVDDNDEVVIVSDDGICGEGNINSSQHIIQTKVPVTFDDVEIEVWEVLSLLFCVIFSIHSGISLPNGMYTGWWPYGISFK